MENKTRHCLLIWPVSHWIKCCKRKKPLFSLWPVFPSIDKRRRNWHFVSFCDALLTQACKGTTIQQKHIWLCVCVRHSVSAIHLCWLRQLPWTNERKMVGQTVIYFREKERPTNVRTIVTNERTREERKEKRRDNKGWSNFIEDGGSTRETSVTEWGWEIKEWNWLLIFVLH